MKQKPPQGRAPGPRERRCREGMLRSRRLWGGGEDIPGCGGTGGTGWPELWGPTSVTWSGGYRERAGC